MPRKNTISWFCVRVGRCNTLFWICSVLFLWRYIGCKRRNSLQQCYSVSVQHSCSSVILFAELIKYNISRRIAEALVFGSWILGQALAYAPNMNAAVYSAGRLFRILDRLPQYAAPATTPGIPFESVPYFHSNMCYVS